MSRPLLTDPTQPAVLKPEGLRKRSIPSSEQKARKRASDREAQRRIRARTRDYIVYLERELAHLKNNQWRDRTIQELLQRNEATEKELLELRKTLRLLEDGSNHSQTSQFASQMTVTDVYPTPASDTMDLRASRADAYRGLHDSQSPINCSFFPSENGSYDLAIDIWQGFDDTSLFSLIQSQSPTQYFNGYILSSPYHSMVTPGSAIPTPF